MTSSYSKHADHINHFTVIDQIRQRHRQRSYNETNNFIDCFNIRSCVNCLLLSFICFLSCSKKEHEFQLLAKVDSPLNYIFRFCKQFYYIHLFDLYDVSALTIVLVAFFNQYHHQQTLYYVLNIFRFCKLFCFYIIYLISTTFRHLIYC